MLYVILRAPWLSLSNVLDPISAFLQVILLLKVFQVFFDICNSFLNFGCPFTDPYSGHLKCNPGPCLTLCPLSGLKGVAAWSQKPFNAVKKCGMV